MSYTHRVGVDLELHPCLTSILDGSEWSALGPGCITPVGKAHGTHWCETQSTVYININEIS